MMETMAWILAATAGVFVLLIIAGNIYLKIRPKFPIRVNCWFCHESTTVAYGERASWDCPFCEQYNGFSADGGYNKPIPAHHDESLNGRVSARGATKRQQGSPPAGNGLCARCNTNQHLKIQQLASFSPSDPGRYDSEVETFRRKLETYYRLCAGCEATLERTLAKQGSWMMGLRLDRLRRSALLQKDVLARRLGRFRGPAVAARFLRYLTSLLASWLLMSAASRLVSPSLPPALHSLLRSALPDLPDSVTIPAALVRLVGATLAWEIPLTVAGGALQLLAGVCQARAAGVGSRWGAVDCLCVVLWAVVHGLCWATSQWNVQWNALVSPRNVRVIHACSVLTTLLCCLAATFKSRSVVGKSVKIHVVAKKSRTPTPLTSKGVDVPASEEVNAAPAKDEVECPPVTIGPETKPNERSPDVSFETVKNESFDVCEESPRPLDSFRTFRTSREGSSAPREVSSAPREERGAYPDPYKTRSRSVRSNFARTPNDITEMLNTSVGNVSLPVKTSTPEKDVFRVDQLPSDIGDGLSNLKLGSPLEDIAKDSGGRREDGYMELFKASTCRRRSVLAPSRFPPRTNVARSSWVAGGFWQDSLPPPSQSSSQSSGFASQSSQMLNSRSSSVCGADYDDGCTSGFCHRAATPDVKARVYNIAGGFGHPRSVSPDSPTFDGGKNVFFAENDQQACFYHGDRMVGFSPSPYYFQQAYPPPPYIYNQPPAYGARFYYPPPIASPSLWNANTFGLPQRQLCIAPANQSRSGSICSESSETSERKPTLYERFARHRASIANALVVVALACSLYYNAVYSGVLVAK